MVCKASRCLIGHKYSTKQQRRESSDSDNKYKDTAYSSKNGIIMENNGQCQTGVSKYPTNNKDFNNIC